MKKIIALLGMSLVNVSFGLDEYLSIEPGKLEVDAGYSFSNSNGAYNEDGKKKDLPGDISPILHGIPLQVKYGIIPGLDAELAVSGLLSNKDGGDLGGFGQPELAVKYSLADIGAGAFVNLILPFATGNLDAPEPALGLALGGVYQNRFGDFRLTGTAGYQLNFENGDKQKNGNILLAYAKPEAMWTEFIGTYLGLKYMMEGDSEFDGEALPGSDGYLFSVLPGLNVQLTPTLAYEVNVPITLLGNQETAAWGISASVYATLPILSH